ITVNLDHVSRGETATVTSKNGNVIASPPGNSLSFPSGSKAASWRPTAGTVDHSQGFSDVTITAYQNSSFRTSAQIRVYQACTAPTISSQPGDISVPYGGSATLAVSVTGSTPISY